MTTKTVCRNGHRFTEENTHIRPDGWRRCRTCINDRKRQDRAKARTVIKSLVVRPSPIQEDEDWRDHAKCATIGGDLWFADAGEREVVERARDICAACPVAAMCLEAGLNEEYGVWGGTSPRERKQLRRQKRA